MDDFWGYLVTSLLVMGGILHFSVKRGVQAWFDSKLAVLGADLQSDISDRQNLNAISQPTFEKIFSKKVDVYTELSKMRNEFTRYKNESYELEHGDLFEDVTERFAGFFARCREVIEANKLYISSELAERYDTWYGVAHPFYKQSVMDGYNAHQNSFDDEHGRMIVYYAELGGKSAMVEKTMPQMEAIFAQIDTDISRIRDYVELAISAKPAA
ncbi:hypothetical protein MIH18_02755 [Marinobacter sp. M3C]|jgi:hypothetical protein|uniref:hypothetical protein n=1 Tax=Marinobacter sp. M3C TaxID=2917715 RepID=UPI00200C1C18|nr:hypothetical protein [Marinobacter sp. M3C]UQG60891.1 hypothetical protein MIH18_02755 [Marinobacter sp. M3C]